MFHRAAIGEPLVLASANPHSHIPAHTGPVLPIVAVLAKNGNKYLSWTVVEAAHFAVRSNAQSNRFYERKTERMTAKTKMVVALKTVSDKLCRACYSMIRNAEPGRV